MERRTRKRAADSTEDSDEANKARPKMIPETTQPESSMSEIREGLAVVQFEGESSVFAVFCVLYDWAEFSVAVVRQFVADLKRQVDEDTATLLEGSGAAPADAAAAKKRRKAYGPQTGVRVLDALSASGLRAIRYAKEVSGLASVVGNDFSESAVATMQKNVRLNQVEEIVQTSYSDAVLLMTERRKVGTKLHVVDLDPYGSPAHFLDSAVQCVEDGGILMVTCTDMGVLCGNAPETCHAKYGSVPARTKFCHEMALRIMLRSIESHANRYARYIQPLLSISVDFYIRCFVRLQTSAAVVKESVCKLSYVNVCTGCQSFELQPLARRQQHERSVKYSPATTAVEPLCAHCGWRQQMAGPIWSAPMHDAAFVGRLLESVKTADSLGTKARIVGMLSLILEEPADVALFYDQTQLCNVVKAPAMKLVAIRSALLHAGYVAGGSHASPTALKTDAPTHVVWDVLRCWVNKLNSESKLPTVNATAVGKAILSKDITLQADFTTHAEAETKSKREGLLRFQCNKGKNWGPKQKAKGSITSVRAGEWSAGGDATT